MRLGDLDALKTILFNDTQYCFWHDSVDGSDVAYTQRDLFKCIDAIPTIDAVPVVHGRWVPKADGFWKKQILICSNCETRNALNYEFNYCPNCGARMDGE